MEDKSRGDGVIQIGRVQASGKWKLVDGFLAVTLETASLDNEHKSWLAEYCTTCSPLAVQLPGQLKAANCTITGFDRGTHATIFYLAEAVDVPRRATKLSGA